MAAFNKFNQFIADVFHAKHNLATSADVVKVMLSNTAPVATNAIKADITEITAQNGYAAGGPASTVSSSSQSSGTFTLICADVTITAAGGTVGPFRYVVAYNDTQTSPAKPLIGYWDYGSNVTLNDGETFTVDFDGVNGILQAA